MWPSLTKPLVEFALSSMKMEPGITATGMALVWFVVMDGTIAAPWQHTPCLSKNCAICDICLIEPSTWPNDTRDPEQRGKLRWT